MENGAKSVFLLEMFKFAATFCLKVKKCVLAKETVVGIFQEAQNHLCQYTSIYESGGP